MEKKRKPATWPTRQNLGFLKILEKLGNFRGKIEV